MFQDKKIRNNHLNFVLIKKIGDCYLDERISNLELEKAMQWAKKRSIASE
jgi:3-dehydroquinate synthetase